jgi:hypothetical protein
MVAVNFYRRICEIYDFFIKSQIVTTPMNHETQAFSNHSANTVEDWLSPSEDEIYRGKSGVLCGTNLG